MSTGTDPRVQELEGKYNIPAASYPSSAAEEAEGISLTIGEFESDENREDLRDLPTVTIDPSDAKDYDDALSAVERYDDGGTLEGYTIWAHIADVSAYVDEYSDIFDEAYNRGVTFYMDVGDGGEQQGYDTRHMLPADLASNICSLVQDETRRAMTVEMHVDREGRIGEYSIYRSLVENNLQISYDTADMLLEEETTSGQLIDCLDVLDDVTTEMRDVRTDKSLMLEQDTASERVVQEAMIGANRCAADTLKRESHGIFRVEPKPAGNWRNRIEKQMAEEGYRREQGWLTDNDNPKRRITQFMQHEVSPTDIEDVRDRVVSNLPAATYTQRPDHHFALGYDAYAHFTSPIRRLGDLVNHMIVTGEFDADRYDESDIISTLNVQEKDAKKVQRILSDN